jgi:hypothetical protein
MARTALAVTPVPLAGVEQELAAANADGHSIVSQSKPAWLVVANGSGGSITVTRALGSATDSATGLAFTAPTYAIPAGETWIVPIKFGAPFAQSGDSNKVYVNFSAVTSVTVACFVIA